MRGWTDGRRREGGGTRRRRRWTATTTGFEIGHERAFISSPAFQPTYARARPRPRTAQTNFFPGRTDDGYKMNRRGRNGTRKVSHNWPFLLEQAAHVGALQAGALLLPFPPAPPVLLSPSGQSVNIVRVLLRVISAAAFPSFSSPAFWGERAIGPLGSSSIMHFSTLAAPTLPLFLYFEITKYFQVMTTNQLKATRSWTTRCVFLKN